MRGGVKIGKNLKILLITAISVIALDLASKAVISAHLHLNQSIEVIPGFFNIVYLKNPGAAFGVFNRGGALRTLFLIAVSGAALVIIVFLLIQSKDALISFALSLIAGGAVGNLIDRLRFGEVVDFLDFYRGTYHWPAFNIADCAITAGVALALFSFYFKGGGRTAG